MQKRQYRATMILDTRNYQDSIETLTENIKTKFIEVGANIEHINNLGQITFERAVDRKFPAGLYLQIGFSATSNVPDAIKSKFQLDHTINRILIEAK